MANLTLSKGKVVLVPFPFDDLSSNKVRPAVCLTNPIGLHQHVVLAFITSQIPDEILDSDLVLQAGDVYFQQTGLRVTSTIRIHRLMTATTSFIRRELGQLPSQIEETVFDKLQKLFQVK